MDIEDYYFPKTDENYLYAEARTREEVGRLLLEDMRKYDHFILASVKGDYGKEIESLFTCAVLLHVPKEIRIQRVKDRSFQKFGSRMLPGGDLYEREKSFLEMVENRPETMTEDWIKITSVPFMRIDGTKPAAYNIEKVRQYVQNIGRG